jgi:hypothetical protein
MRKKGFADLSDWITAEGDTKRSNKITRIMPMLRRTINFVGRRDITVSD